MYLRLRPVEDRHRRQGGAAPCGATSFTAHTGTARWACYIVLILAMITCTKFARRRPVRCLLSTGCTAPRAARTRRQPADASVSICRSGPLSVRPAYVHNRYFRQTKVAHHASGSNRFCYHSSIMFDNATRVGWRSALQVGSHFVLRMVPAGPSSMLTGSAMPTVNERMRPTLGDPALRGCAN
jgi:hypothetical protein